MREVSEQAAAGAACLGESLVVQPAKAVDSFLQLIVELLQLIHLLLLDEKSFESTAHIPAEADKGDEEKPKAKIVKAPVKFEVLPEGDGDNHGVEYRDAQSDPLPHKVSFVHGSLTCDSPLPVR